MYMRNPNTGAHIAQMIGTLASFDKVQAMMRLLATTLCFLAILSRLSPLLFAVTRMGGTLGNQRTTIVRHHLLCRAHGRTAMMLCAYTLAKRCRAYAPCTFPRALHPMNLEPALCMTSGDDVSGFVSCDHSL